SNSPPSSEISTLSLHDALPILLRGYPCALPAPDRGGQLSGHQRRCRRLWHHRDDGWILVRPDDRSREFRSRGCQAHQNSRDRSRSEEHTSELQSLTNLVCRLLL